MRVATEVRALMARYDIVQLDLQKALGLSQSAVSKRLRGVTPFDVNELDEIARFFGMSLAELIKEADEPRPNGPTSAGRRSRGSVRREGIEPPTRWLSNFPGQRSIHPLPERYDLSHLAPTG
jgi:transcriptional regulator with XRE-family HTH domain